MNRFLAVLALAGLAAAARAADAPKPAPKKVVYSPEERQRREEFSKQAKADLKRFHDRQDLERAQQKEKEAAALVEYRKSLDGKSTEERKRLQREYAARALADRKEFNERQKRESDDFRKERKAKEAAFRSAAPPPVIK